MENIKNNTIESLKTIFWLSNLTGIFPLFVATVTVLIAHYIFGVPVRW